jgi:fatty-acyl-CoA synthase
VLERVPFRLGDTQVVAAPLFHAWGLSNLLLGLSRCTTNVLARTFAAEATLRSVRDEHADVLVVVPVMLSRMLAIPIDVLDELATPELRIIASSGSALGSGLTTALLDRFGPVLYNFYGSTEVAIATVATPDDLRRAPSTAGRVAFGVEVEILDADGEPVPDGTIGRVFVGGSMRFDGYTTGGSKEQRRGLLSSGDLGHFDDGLPGLHAEERQRLARVAIAVAGHVGRVAPAAGDGGIERGIRFRRGLARVGGRCGSAAGDGEGEAKGQQGGVRTGHGVVPVVRRQG